MLLFRPWRFVSFLIASVLLVVGISCSNKNQSSAPTNLSADMSIDRKPIGPNMGWSDDQCLSCLCTVNAFPDQVGYQALSSTTQPTTEWMNKTNFCKKRDLCGAFSYSNAWSPLLMVKRCADSGLMKKWNQKSEDREPTVCFYEHAFFGGREQCFKTGQYAQIEGPLRGKISSLKLIGSGKLTIWQKADFGGEKDNTIKDMAGELPPAFSDNVGSFILDDTSETGPSPAKLTIPDENTFKASIEETLSGIDSQENFVKKLLSSTYQAVEQLCMEQQKQKYNVLVLSQEISDRGQFEHQIFNAEFKFQNKKSYWVRVFRSGSFRYQGTLGWSHWGMTGNFKRSGNDGRDVTFDVPQ